ncbi:putative phage protein [Streptococcus iniae]|nr:putative phage protein [Streptococcus iniae]
MALDYQQDYIDLRTENKSETRSATQADFDNF